MDPTPRVSANGAAGVSGVLKAAAGRAKSAAATALKRRRGALQDISNNHTRGANASTAATATSVKKPLNGGGGVAKPTATSGVAARGVKRSASSMSQATANVRTRGPRLTAAQLTKRRRENAAEDPSTTSATASGKVQTSLLSFKSIAGTTMSVRTQQTKAKATSTAAKEDPIEQNEEAGEADAASSKEDEMECKETLKPETSQPEPTPTLSVAPVEQHQPETKAPVEAVQSAPVVSNATGQVPPYEPRPFVFKFDHRESGFDEETYRSQVCDIDDPFHNSAIHCVKIARDIDRFHRQHEEKYHPTPDYIGNVQLDINEKMRTILIDWLVEVGEEYELDSRTFHKTVNLVDRCLATFKINRKQFQLLGCACMMIAAKFEEVYGPNVDEFVYISDQTYTSEEMLEMEMKVLDALEYRIASTTCHGFLPRFTRAGCTTDKQRFLVQYLCDFALLYYHMLEYRPSMLAASAVYLSRLMTNEENPWTPTLHHYTQYNAWELKACVMDLFQIHKAECDLVETQRDKAKAVSEKYVAEKFLSVSMTPSIDETVLEQSFLAYEPPKHMRRQMKQESSSTENSASEE